MRVLVACERSGVVRRAFRAAGADAWSCDLLPSRRGRYFHLEMDAIEAAKAEHWDLLIAHPPCRYLSVSGARWFSARREEQADALAFVRELMMLSIERIAIENPISIISTAIRRPDQIIQPYQFGDDASKATCLWLKNLAPLKPTRFVMPRRVNGKNRWSNQTDSGQNRLGPSDDRAELRAITYPGIAAAMAEQWTI